MSSVLGDFSQEPEEKLYNTFDINSVAAALYFLKKYKNIVCIANVKPIIWFCIGKDNCNKKLIIPDDLMDRIYQCDKRFIFGFIKLVNDTSGHQNIFIIDRDENSVELFEPHGQVSPSYFGNEEYLKILQDKFSSFGIDTFYKPTNYCPHKSFQRLQHDERLIIDDISGYCQFWSIWWLNYRLKHPHKTRQELIKQALDSFHGKSLTRFINLYTKHIVKIRNTFLKDKDKTILRYKNIGFRELNEYERLVSFLEDELRKEEPVVQSAQDNDLGKCEDKICPDNKICRVATGNCVFGKSSKEDIVTFGGKKYLVIPNKKIIPTINNFKEIYIREYIYSQCSDKLTKDELYLVLFYNKPINGADKIWDNIK